MKIILFALAFILSSQFVQARPLVRKVAGTETNSSRVYVNFGQVPVNSREVQDYVVTNTDPTPLKMTAFQVSGIGFEAYEDSCENLAQNAKCIVQIAFWPFFVGFQFGDLFLQFDHDEIHFDLAGSGTR